MSQNGREMAALEGNSGIAAGTVLEGTDGGGLAIDSLERRIVAIAIAEACTAMKDESEWWRKEVIRLDAEVSKAAGRLDALDEATMGTVNANGTAEGGEAKTIAWLSEWAARLDQEFDRFRRNMDVAMAAGKKAADEGRASLEQHVKVLQVQVDHIEDKLVSSPQACSDKIVRDTELQKLSEQQDSVRRSIDEVWHGLAVERQERQEKCQALSTAIDNSLVRLIKKWDKNFLDLASGSHSNTGLAPGQRSPAPTQPRGSLDETVSAISVGSSSSVTAAPSGCATSFGHTAGQMTFAQRGFVKAQASMLASSNSEASMSKPGVAASSGNAEAAKLMSGMSGTGGGSFTLTVGRIPQDIPLRESFGSGTQSSTARASSIGLASGRVSQSGLSQTRTRSSSRDFRAGYEAAEATDLGQMISAAMADPSVADTLLAEQERKRVLKELETADPGDPVADAMHAMQERRNFLKEIHELRERNVTLREEIDLRDRQLARQQVSMPNFIVGATPMLPKASAASPQGQMDPVSLTGTSPAQRLSQVCPGTSPQQQHKALPQTPPVASSPMAPPPVMAPAASMQPCWSRPVTVRTDGAVAGAAAAPSAQRMVIRGGSGYVEPPKWTAPPQDSFKARPAARVVSPVVPKRAASPVLRTRANPGMATR